MIKVLIVDDESPARKRMRSLVAAELDLELIGESADGEDALAKIQALEPDLVFLDIRLPGMSGLELSRLLQDERSPYVVFTTAHGEYAPEAFRVDAVDYLMKPFDGQRLKEALEKVRARLKGAEIVRTEAVVADFMVRLGGLAQALDASQPQRIGVKDGGRLKLMELADISYVRADGDYLQIHRDDGSQTLVREPLAELVERIGNPDFVRISRSVAVNLGHVTELRPHGRGDYEFCLRSGERFVSGPTHRDTVQSLVARFR